ncbi:MAG: thioredoxin [Actinobacteria bacterium]|nr:thioredoxin [Actinomycetota bacterium]
MAGDIVKCESCGTKNRVPIGGKGKAQCANCKKPLPWLVNATDATIDQALDSKQLVLVDLWAPWCGPCRMVAPVLERMSKTYAGQVKVVKVNVDDSPRTSQRFQASSIPTLVLWRDGKVVDRIIGAQPAPVLKQHVDAALAG